MSLVAVKLLIEEICITLELVLILLRRLVCRSELHLLKFLSRSFFLLTSDLFLLCLKGLLLPQLIQLLLLLILFLLAALEGFEDVLVVK